MHELPPGVPEPSAEPAYISAVDQYYRSQRRERMFEALRSGGLYEWAQIPDLAL